MLDLALLRNASFTGLLTGALLLQASAFGCLALVSLWPQCSGTGGRQDGEQGAGAAAARELPGSGDGLTPRRSEIGLQADTPSG